MNTPETKFNVSFSTSSYYAHITLKKGSVISCLPFGYVSAKEPTEKQLNYAKDLGITVPNGISRMDISAIINRVEDGERVTEKVIDTDNVAFEVLPLPGPNEAFALFAHEMGIKFSKYIGEKELFHTVVYGLSDTEKAAFFAYCVVCFETNSPIQDMRKHPQAKDFYTCAKHIVNDQSALISLNKIEPSGYITPHRGTKAYKTVMQVLPGHCDRSPKTQPITKARPLEHIADARINELKTLTSKSVKGYVVGAIVFAIGFLASLCAAAENKSGFPIAQSIFYLSGFGFFAYRWAKIQQAKKEFKKLNLDNQKSRP